MAVTSTIINGFPFMVSEDRWWKEKSGMNRFKRAYSDSRVQQACKFAGTKESVYIRKELIITSHKIGPVHMSAVSLFCNTNSPFLLFN